MYDRGWLNHGPHNVRQHRVPVCQHHIWWKLTNVGLIWCLGRTLCLKPVNWSVLLWWSKSCKVLLCHVPLKWGKRLQKVHGLACVIYWLWPLRKIMTFKVLTLDLEKVKQIREKGSMTTWVFNKLYLGTFVSRLLCNLSYIFKYLLLSWRKKKQDSQRLSELDECV